MINPRWWMLINKSYKFVHGHLKILLDTFDVFLAMSPWIIHMCMIYIICIPISISEWYPQHIRKAPGLEVYLKKTVYALLVAALPRPGRLHAGGADLLQGQLGPCLRPPGDSHPEKVGWWCLNHYCLVLWNMNFMTFHILGRISSQLRNSIIFQRGRSTTNQMKYPMKSITWHRKLRRRWWRRSCCRTICWLSRATNCAAWTSERSWRSSKAKPRDELIKADELRLIKRWDWDGLGHFLASMLGCIMQLPLKWTVWKVTLW